MKIIKNYKDNNIQAHAMVQCSNVRKKIWYKFRRKKAYDLS